MAVPPEIAEALASLEASIKAENAGVAAKSAEQQQPDTTEASQSHPEMTAAADQPQMPPAGGCLSAKNDGSEAIAEPFSASSTPDTQHGNDSSTADAAEPVDNGAKTRRPQADSVMTEAARTSSITGSSNALQAAGDCHRRSNQGPAVPAGTPNDMPSPHAIKGAAPSSSPMQPRTSQLDNGSIVADSAGGSALQASDADSPDARQGPGTSLVNDNESQGTGDACSAIVNEDSMTDEAIQQSANETRSTAPETQQALAILTSPDGKITIYLRSILEVLRIYEEYKAELSEKWNTCCLRHDNL